MVKGFEIVQNSVYEVLAKKSFELKNAGEEDGISTAVYANSEMAYKLEYNSDDKKFRLLRAGISEGEIGAYTVVETYLFDPAPDEEQTEATLLAAEFCESLTEKVAVKKTAPVLRSQSKKDKESDETGSVFFANRFPSVMPEVREPLMAHKQHYGMLLPNNFCDQCVGAAMLTMLAEKKDKQKMQKFFGLLSEMYKNGDMDVKSIIVQTILCKITDDSQEEVAKIYLSEELIKAWMAGKRYYGKTLRPEKKSVTQKMLEGMEGNRLNR